MNNSVFFVALVAFLAIGSLEFGLRLYYFGEFTPFKGGPRILQPDRQLGTTVRPDIRTSIQRLAFIKPVTVNSLGMRGEELPEKGGKFRIAVIGDTHVFGGGVLDSETLPVRLERHLNSLSGGNNLEVVNFGALSTNTVQQVIRAQRLLPKVKPDLLLLVFNSENDLQYNIESLRKRVRANPKRPVARLDSGGKLVFDYSAPERYFQKFSWRLDQTLEDRPWYLNTAIYMRLRVFWHTFKKETPEDPNISMGLPYLAEFAPQYSQSGLNNSDYEKMWNETWEVTKALILQMRDLSSASGAKFAMTVFVSNDQMDKRFLAGQLTQFPELKTDLLRINRMFEEFSSQSSVPALDLHTAFMARHGENIPSLYYSRFDSHLTAAGQDAVARLLAEQLLESGLL